MGKGDTKYLPLDEILEQPATRLLRALRWFDWVTPGELFAAAGVPDWIAEKRKENPERNAASAALSRLVKLGFVERGRRTVDGHVHRITTDGLIELERRLRGVVKHKHRPRTCAACGVEGHYAVTCRERRAA